jgi:hypothetical protein
MLSKLHVYLLSALMAGAVLVPAAGAQSAKAASTSGSPVAYVYVSRPTHVDGFSASSTGQLTPVPGSPFSGISVSHMSVTNKFLFGAGDDNQTLFSYSLGANGAIVKQVGAINTHDYNPADNDCFDVGPTQIDFAHATLYNDDWNCDGDSQFIQSYKIEPSGQLTFLASDGGQSEDYTMSPPVVLGTDQYLYVVGNFNGVEAGGLIQGYKRQSNGSAELALPQIGLPQPANPDHVYTPYQVLASDPTDHLALAFQEEDDAGDQFGPPVLASFTAQSNGDVASTNPPEKMAASDLAELYVMSISPTGKLLAVSAGGTNHPPGDMGFQLFHFNGASPITPYTGVLQGSYIIDQFGWDKSNHLYVLGGGYLWVYTVTPTSIKEAPGSPYSIPESSSVIVLDLP